MRGTTKFLILCAILKSGWGIAAEDWWPEKKALLTPRNSKTSVVLLEKSKFAPTSAVISGNFVFYTNAKTSGRCRGNNVYRSQIFPFDEKQHDVLVSAVGCVTALHVDGDTVYVTYDNETGDTKMIRLSVNDAMGPKPADPGDTFWDNLAQASFLFDSVAHKEKLSLVNRKASFSFSDARALTLVRFLPSAGPRLLLSRIEDFSDPALPARIVDIKFSALMDLDSVVSRSSRLRRLELREAVESSGKIYLTISDSAYEEELFSSVLVVDIIKNALVNVLGSSLAGRTKEPWQEISENRWWVRKGRWLTPTEHGFVIADRTEYDQETRTLSYYLEPEHKFFRLDLPTENIGGLSFHANGMVVSHPQSGEVRWMGPRDQDQFARELTRIPL
jgi:hypothetical protein